MSTNHNRIKVSDLETNEHDKILKTNLKGELEFSDVSTLKTENYNALDCTSEGKALDARQGKVLKDMIDDSVDIASDEETQIDNAVPEDKKVVSRSKLFNWWENIKTKQQTISETWKFSNGANVLQIGWDAIKWITPDGWSTQLKNLTPTQNRTLSLPNKSGTVAIINDWVTTAAGTATTPPLIIPNGTLLTKPKNGAIERDENGVLWETHGGVRNQLSGGSDVSLVNDLTTGGTTKALTAEMGKTLENTKLTASLATDPETQIASIITEDKKVISRLKLFNWWQWIKSQTQTISGAWNFTNKMTLASGTKDTPSLIIPSGTLTITPQNGAIERDENGQLWETHEGIRSKLLVGKAGIELKGEFSNNSEALAANLKAGDYYSTPIQSYSDIGLVAVTKNPPGYLTLVFPNPNAAAAALGINNINNIDDWNTFFTSKGSANFTKVLHVNERFIRFLAEDSREIKVINLSNIQTTSVYLNDLFSVTDIDLSNNKLTGFDIEKYPLLENLILTNNLITRFNPSVGFPETLKKLILNNNKLSEFEPIKGLPNSLVELNLEENLLDAFGDNIEMPTNLKILNLNKNKIGSFSMVVPKFLETLLLSGNNLSDWESNSIHQTNLLLLDLSYNEFSHFYITGGLPDGIKTLKLSHNKMDDFLTSKQLPWALKRLELNDNDFVDFNPKYLAGDDLEIILLQNNKIVTFNPQSLNDTLHKLNLGNNKIVNFNPTLFPSEINTLNLENNPITSIGWNTNTNWINSLGIEEGILYAGNTVGSIDGTNTESMLKDLSWTITKTPYPFL